jgi:putative membrane protein
MDGWLEAIRSYIGEAGALDASLHAFATGFPVFALHGAITVGILLVGLLIHTLVTPYRELKLVREDHNPAAGLALAGSIVSMAVPLSFAMASSLNWADIVIWGVITILVQLIAIRLVDLLLPDMSRRIKNNEIAAASVLVGMRLAFGFILAAAVAGAPLARL